MRFLKFHEDMAYLKITEFNIEFKADLEPVMEEIREGGIRTMLSSISPLTVAVSSPKRLPFAHYLTDENISLYMTTLAKSSSTYDVEGDKAIDAKFYFVTSGATYSAANLATALAKEMGVIKTIGTRSGGGACSVKALVWPNGAVMQMSSNMNLTYSTYTTVEEGVDVDYFIDFYSSGKNYYDYGIRPRFPSIEFMYNVIVEMNEENPE